MSQEEFEKAIKIGAEQTDECADKGCNIICMGKWVLQTHLLQAFG